MVLLSAVPCAGTVDALAPSAISCGFGLPWCKLSIHCQQEMKCEMPLVNHCTDILTLKLLACQYFGAHSVIFPKICHL